MNRPLITGEDEGLLKKYGNTTTNSSPERTTDISSKQEKPSKFSIQIINQIL